MEHCQVSRSPCTTYIKGPLQKHSFALDSWVAEIRLSGSEQQSACQGALVSNSHILTLQDCVVDAGDMTFDVQFVNSNSTSFKAKLKNMDNNDDEQGLFFSSYNKRKEKIVVSFYKCSR